MKRSLTYRMIRFLFAILFCVGMLFWGDQRHGWSLASNAGTITSSAIMALEPVVETGLTRPVLLTQAPGTSSQLIVVEQPGRVQVIERGRLQPSPMLDISDRVLYGGERGLLGLAFHPKFTKNGRLFVNYTRQPDGATVIAEYRRSSPRSSTFDQERILLVVQQPYSNHNGGMMAFGQDGFLYTGMGDGGAGGDPGNRAQDMSSLLGKMIRLDVDTEQSYAIPPENPFRSGGERREIYALGLRNPWRFSFDMKTGLLWAGDVGQEEWEEIDIIRRGGNYGWRAMEGSHCFLPIQGCIRQGMELPLAEYQHQKGRCSVIGGYVYRGKAVPALDGRYLFGDFCSGEIFALSRNAEQGEPGSGRISLLLKSGLKISSFGQDRSGEVYVLDITGRVLKIVPSPSG